MLRGHHLFLVCVSAGLLLFGTFFLVYRVFFSAPPVAEGEPRRFVVSLSEEGNSVMPRLLAEDFAINDRGLRFALRVRGCVVDTIAPGAYRVGKTMNAFRLAGILCGEPYMKWVVIPEGYRKEEIADVLARQLGWDAETVARWIAVDTAIDADYVEGVYFPDTYLIPTSETSSEVAERMRARFNERFAPLAPEVAKQNIKWTTLLKVASLVQREAAGKSDMPLIAGVIWNRLLNDQRLEIDTTLQYMKGNAKDGWWPRVTPEDKAIDSPYNTYRYSGLPPRPIANPGYAAIEAALFPEATECFFYLHDPEGNIHCAKDYEGHKANIEEYLR
jgi:UPF0755 protein